MKLVFFIKSFNDVDHFTPLLDKLLYQKKHNIYVFCTKQSFRYNENHNIRYLNKKYDLFVKDLFNINEASFRFNLYSLILKKIETSNFLNKYLKYWHPYRAKIVTYLYRTMPSEYLNQVFDLNPDALIFDWNAAYVYPQRAFVEKTKKLNIPTYCLPHGILLYTNKYPTKKQRLTSADSDLFYDYYLFYGESEQYLLDRGIPKKNIYLIGSMRYSSEWIETYKTEVIDDIQPLSDIGKDNIKVVFFLSQHIYNVDETLLMETLKALSKLKKVTVILKPHTRGMSTGFLNRLGFIIDENTSSVILSDWCDVAILYGSSIGLQILSDNKTLIYPNYIDTNSTMFDKYNACIKVENVDELISVIKSIANGTNIPSYNSSNVKELFSSIVYANKSERSIISDCIKFIEQHQNNHS
jgi:hypothetical protein